MKLSWKYISDIQRTIHSDTQMVFLKGAIKKIGDLPEVELPPDLRPEAMILLSTVDEWEDKIINQTKIHNERRLQHSKMRDGTGQLTLLHIVPIIKNLVRALIIVIQGDNPYRQTYMDFLYLLNKRLNQIPWEDYHKERSDFILRKEIHYSPNRWTPKGK